jgi:dihydroorotase
MKILIKQAKIIDVSSSFNGQEKDVLIDNGVIVKIGNNITSSDKKTIELSSENLHVSKGWVDLKAHFCDPGEEHKETLSNGLDSAASGGYTHVAILPSTEPVIDHKSLIDYVLNKSEHHAVNALPMACITKKMKGDELSEMYDLQLAGACMFSDDIKTPKAQVLKNALLYTSNYDSKISVNSFNHSLSHNAQVNEGEASIRTGLKADPEISEVIEIEKHIRLVEYTGGQLHLSGISTKEGVRLIKAAKKKGMKITADVHLMNLCFNESQVVEFDTIFKTLPVLRSQNNVDALWQGLSDQTIDFIVTDHRPTVKEEKELEFEYATFGAPQLKTAYSALNTQNILSSEHLVEILSCRPRKFMGLEQSTIKEGSKADLTLFDPEECFRYNVKTKKEEKIYSPFSNEHLKGQVLGIVNNNKLILNE